MQTAASSLASAEREYVKRNSKRQLSNSKLSVNLILVMKKSGSFGCMIMIQKSFRIELDFKYSNLSYI